MALQENQRPNTIAPPHRGDKAETADIGIRAKMKTPAARPGSFCRKSPARELLGVVVRFRRRHKAFEATKQILFRHAVELDIA